MNTLNLSENIVRLRHNKKITQEQLADFIGVTKASVSKWETKQSMPDVLLLPRLAAFFDVTIDELLGYEPQLSREQIRKLYHDLAAAFAEEPFEEVMKRSGELVKKYYSCYPFLFQICVLWLNHFMLADGQKRWMEVLADISGLCDHIVEGCKDIGICNDTVILKAGVGLQMGKPEEVIEILEEILNPYRLSSQSDAALIQAYMLAGKKDKANSFTQMSMYLHLMNLIAGATQYITIHSDNFDICEETIRRVKQIDEAYDLEHLHPNSAAVFRYQAAIVYCMHGKKQEALHMLKRYAASIDALLTGKQPVIHGDRYFDRIDEWAEQLDIGADAPRDKRVIWESAVQALENPVFAVLHEEAEYQSIKKFLTGRKDRV